MSHKAAFISILGRPNAGKSTLMNLLLGEKLCIITPKAQTTRHRIKGILSRENLQLIFSDTPGIIDPAYKLHEAMMSDVDESIKDADLFLVLFTPETNLNETEWVTKLSTQNKPLIILLNKVDTMDQPSAEKRLEEIRSKFEKATVMPFSALHAFNKNELIQLLESLSPEHPPYFAPNELTDRNERFFVAEILREQILLHYEKEIPYSVEVVINEFKDKPNITSIRATLYVMRDSQKAILIGKNGQALKKTGTAARLKMEKFLDRKVFLDLTVKVQSNWRDNDNLLKQFGYKK
ncbi:MAG TPA: GTPase Era [Bacteroidia bacterium]|nr:GTPase Era [Bacteroidia bacterium]HNT80667.1 GTPase Era [Bacteroidia bacterium]